MNLQKCDHCRSEEQIPTYQFIKYEGSIKYLCTRCWMLFRQKCFGGLGGKVGERGSLGQGGNLGRCANCRTDEGIPNHQFVKFDDAHHYLCRKCWDVMKNWLRFKTDMGDASMGI